MPLYRRAEISPRRARGCAASWTADLAVVEARQPSSVVFQRPEAKLGQRASAGSGRSTLSTLAECHTRRADGSASTPACSLRDVAAPLGACSHQRSSAAPGRPCSRTSLMASLMASLMVASRGCHHFVTAFTYHTATARFRACSGALAVPVTFGRPMRPGRASQARG